MEQQETDFYFAIADWYDEIFPLSKQKEDFVKRMLKPGHCDILDIGCATGSLCLSLAEQSFRTVGIDLNRRMVGIASQKAAHSDSTARFLVGDMTKLDAHFPENSFDAALCLGNTLVHLADIEKVSTFVKQAQRVIRKDGLLMVQIVNYDRILDNEIRELPVVTTDTFKFERGYIHKRTGKILFRSRLTIKNPKVIYLNQIYLYPLKFSEIDRFIRAAGFRNIRYFATYQEELFHKRDSHALVLVAEK